LGGIGVLCGGRSFLLRLPFKGVVGKESRELGQCDRLLSGIDDSFQFGFKAHSAIGTFAMVPEIEPVCVFIGGSLVIWINKKGVRSYRTP
jgi:hypothetical protein